MLKPASFVPATKEQSADLVRAKHEQQQPGACQQQAATSRTLHNAGLCADYPVPPLEAGASGPVDHQQQQPPPVQHKGNGTTALNSHQLYIEKRVTLAELEPSVPAPVNAPWWQLFPKGFVQHGTAPQEAPVSPAEQQRFAPCCTRQ